MAKEQQPATAIYYLFIFLQREFLYILRLVLEFFRSTIAQTNEKMARAIATLFFVILFFDGKSDGFNSQGRLITRSRATRSREILPLWCSLSPEQGPPATDSNPRAPRFNLASRGVPLLGAAMATVFILSENMPGNMRAGAGTGKYPIVGEESLMSAKSHGTSATAVQSSLRWGVDVALADQICNYNRHWAENWGYFRSSSLIASLQDSKTTIPVTFYDSVTGAPLFRAPVGRSVQEFIDESLSHGWPSFRDEEVVWDNVRCLKDGETVSLTGTHLGHNLPDRGGNRYCINLVSVAALPPKSS